jgi:Flp pilus assembly pilin Flp
VNNRRRATRPRSTGQSSVEYLIIVALVVMVLVNGNPSPLQQFFDAVKNAYQRFTYAMSAV